MATLNGYNPYAGEWYIQYPQAAQPAMGAGIMTTTTPLQQQLSQAWSGAAFGSGSLGNYENGAKTLETIKGAIHTIKTEAVSEETRATVETKVEKYARAGLTKQAEILQMELKARIRLARIKEWEYKVLPAKAIQAYNGRMFGGYTYCVHIDPIEKYIGLPEGSEVTTGFDKIVPEKIVDSLLEAQKRQVFDEFSVLWVEKVKDPLLLGKIKELPDYFLIDEWGDDVTFSDIIKAPKENK